MNCDFLGRRLKNINTIPILFVLVFYTSCIPTKKIVYLEAEEDKATELTINDWVYKIKAGDRFYIKVTDPLSGVTPRIMEQSGEQGQRINLIQQSPSLHDYLVLEDGTIDYPLLGKIKASGKSIIDLRKEIEKACEGVIKNPSIKLFMTNYNVTVLGEANSPGFSQLITDRPTFFDAIGLASDLTDFANRKKVKVIRKSEGKVNVHYVDVTDPEFVQSQFYYIHPNDVIHVMPLGVKKYSNDNALPLVLSIITTVITVITITTR